VIAKGLFAEMALLSKPVLLIDVSNSYTKGCLADDRRMGRIWKRTTKDVTWAWVGKTLHKDDIQEIYLSSVVPVVTRIIQELTGEGIQVRILKGTAQLPISIDYPEPDKIGADRIANAIAAYTKYGAPSVVIDFGTAVTFDVIGAAGCYAGGVIAPGLNVMTEYLHEKTALLPLVKLQEPRCAVAKSTVEAIRVGAMYGYRGMIVEILNRIKAELRARSLKIIATGGQAEIVVGKINQKIHIDPTLTLYGLWTWAKFLKSSGSVS
jgi:type III pantothenate kinase